MFFQVLFFLSACILNVSAGIEDYFKKNLLKPEQNIHQMHNIDFIYIINLDQRPEKYKSCVDQLAPYNIHPYRFSAVNGWELSLEMINDLGVKLDNNMTTGKWGTSYLMENNFEPHHEVVHQIGRTYFCHCMGRGPIGIVLSHLSILQDAYDSGYKTIWVMEDDIQVLQNPHLISNMIDELDILVGKRNWDILFTDQDTKNQLGHYVPCTAYAWRPNFQPANPSRFTKRINISANLRKIGARYGAYSMIVRRSGMKKILNFFKTYKVFLPYDMDFVLPNDINVYTVLHDIVSTQPNAISDNGAPRYKLKDQN